MKVRTAQKLRDALLIGGFLIMLAGGYYHKALFIFGMLMSFSCLIPHFLYNRCPHCKKQLGRNEEKFCQYCGGAIDT